MEGLGAHVTIRTVVVACTGSHRASMGQRRLKVVVQLAGIVNSTQSGKWSEMCQDRSLRVPSA
ncbi:hypothetical protein QFZ76_010172 [Streptomyces sp. V4I2]|nr:hypothetical protein [Streptomyces sp. V4I2]